MTHIGIIRALEENNIPIDYIAGTSMGAIIGSLYAMGYSPDDMERLIGSDEFKRWYTGTIEPRYEYFFKKSRPGNSGIISERRLFKFYFCCRYRKRFGACFFNRILIKIINCLNKAASKNYKLRIYKVYYTCNSAGKIFGSVDSHIGSGRTDILNFVIDKLGF